MTRLLKAMEVDARRMKLPPLLVLSLAAGCTPQPTPADSGVPAATPDAASPIVLEQGDEPDVEFLQPADERLVTALQACLMTRARGDRWVHETWQSGERGTSLLERWCRPSKGEAECPVHRTQRPDNEWIELALDVHPVARKAVRVKLDMGSHPSRGWGAQLAWNRRLLPPTGMERDPVFFYVEFRQIAGGRTGDRLRLGTQQNYFVTKDISVLTESRDTARGELARLTASEDTFRSAAMFRWYEIKRRVEKGLGDDTFTMCDPVPGAPESESCWATCEPRRPLTRDEKADVGRKLTEDFEKETARIAGGYRERYAELMALLPSSACWRLLVE